MVGACHVTPTRPPGFPSDIRPCAGSLPTRLTTAPVGVVRWAPPISGRSASDSGDATGPGLNFFATSWKLAMPLAPALFRLSGLGPFFVTHRSSDRPDDQALALDS